MTATEMEDLLRNLDLRTSRIEQILPTLATKDDLKAFATKEDLKAFATKEDLKAYPTKEDLKEALKLYATKDDLRNELNGVRVLIEDLRDSVGMLAAHLADISQRIPPRS